MPHASAARGRRTRRLTQADIDELFERVSLYERASLQLYERATLLREQTERLRDRSQELRQQSEKLRRLIERERASWAGVAPQLPGGDGDGARNDQSAADRAIWSSRPR